MSVEIDGVRWYEAKELAGIPGIPAQVVDVVTRWGRTKPRRTKPSIDVPGKGWMYPEGCLPEVTQGYFKAQRDEEARKNSPEGRAGAAAAELLREDAEARRAARQADVEAKLALFAQATSERGERCRAWLEVYQAWQSFFKERYADRPRQNDKALKAFVAKFDDDAGSLGIDPSAADVVVQSSGRGRCATVKGLSFRTLKRKVLKVEASGIGALVDSHRNARRGESLISTQPRLEEYVLAILYQRPAVEAVRIYELAEWKFGGTDVKVPSLTAMERWLKAWKERNASAYLFIRDPDDWKNRDMPAVGDAGGDVVRVNQRWELDSTMGDLLLDDGKRHALIGVIDVFTRRGKLLVAPTSKASAIAALTRRAIIDWGVPESVKLDNGKDYTSNYMTGVFESLEIERDLCPPFTPECKPYIERFLGTFNHDLVELKPGYIGHDVAERKSIEARRSFAQRLMKRDAVLEIGMTPQQMQIFCDEWVENVYHRRPHAGLDGDTPFLKAAGCAGTERRIDNERALDVLLSPPVGGGTRTLQKKGLSIQNGWYSHPDLWSDYTTGDFFKVFLDETDLGRVYVYDAKGFVCVAICPARLGMAPEEIRAHAMACKREAMEVKRAEVKRLKNGKSSVNLDEQINGFLRTKAEEAGKVSTLPLPSASHTTPALKGAGEAAEAVDSAPKAADAARNHAQAVRLMNESQGANAVPIRESVHPLDAIADDDDESRYDLWHELDATVKAGADLFDPRFRKFYDGFHETTRYKAVANRR